MPQTTDKTPPSTFHHSTITSSILHYWNTSEKKDFARLAPLQSRINFVHHVMAGVVGPTNTSLCHTARQNAFLQERLLLDGVDVQSGADVPCDMAMERPDSRVICDVLENNIPRCGSGARLHNLHVATLSVLLVSDLAVPGSDALSQDVEVVPVEMHGVRGWELVLDNDADGAVVPEVVDVPLGIKGVGNVALIGQDKDRVTVGDQSQQLEDGKWRN